MGHTGARRVEPREGSARAPCRPCTPSENPRLTRSCSSSLLNDRAVPLDEEAKANTLEAISKVRLIRSLVTARLLAPALIPPSPLGFEQMYDLAIFEYNQLDTPDPLAQKVDIRSVSLFLFTS